MAEETTSTPESSSPVLMEIFYEIIQSPINLALIGVIALLVYKILQSHLGAKKVSTFVPEPELPRLRRDFTLQELRPFDGTGTDGRVLVAVNGSVYDVTKGKRFYGPGECGDQLKEGRERERERGKGNLIYLPPLCCCVIKVHCWLSCPYPGIGDCD